MAAHISNSESSTEFDVRSKEEFENFKVKFNRSYKDDDEHDMRYGIFKETLKVVEKHNKEAEKGVHTFTMGINNFADMTPEEKRVYTGFLPPRKNNQ